MRRLQVRRGWGVQRTSDLATWPLEAAGPAELEERLQQGGHLHWPGTFRAFNDYATHVDVLMIYTLNPDSNGRVEDLEIIVQEPWRIASRERSSTTREYLGAVTSLDALRSGLGAFATPAEFYDYWRKYPFRLSSQVQTQLQRLLKVAQDELTELRKRTSPEAE
jgi:hypothetical protein